MDRCFGTFQGLGIICGSDRGPSQPSSKRRTNGDHLLRQALSGRPNIRGRASASEKPVQAEATAGSLKQNDVARNTGRRHDLQPTWKSLLRSSRFWACHAPTQSQCVISGGRICHDMSDQPLLESENRVEHVPFLACHNARRSRVPTAHEVHVLPSPYEAH